ncbi:CPBP family intramembrane glutamic endopeptidase [Methanolobus halotolerans]|uniref:CPBP family intramembrane metalloprotease domain-containing protein n=1 Tax=Methanolobus halotolerans TaxID=2052935 RepID=A0A4E0Q990_9EURY|nr:CPBP family intramembrane glutamic endopeptidase [Methanolobus halotolerans]TGC08707.1 CPBP family intramembrane metalloprotease domain-containing protein [Methanolobus halotolerans]
MRFEGDSPNKRDPYGVMSVFSLYSGILVIFFILFIVLAEMLLFTGMVQASLTLHFLALIGIAFSTIWVRDRNILYSLQALMLLPLLRIINVSMPLPDESIFIYVIIYILMLVPLFLLIRHQGLSATDLGVTFNKILRYIPLSIVVGLLIAEGEYIAMGSAYLSANLPMQGMVGISILIFLFVGIVEELIFRSILQSRLEVLFGLNAGLVFTSVLFGIMHAGYGVPSGILITTLAGFVLGYMFQKTRSLPLVILTHSFASIFLFVIIPVMGAGIGII